jgi:8-oxo-dGTP pyrophosphatase MutT (NUDIX family)
VVKPDAVVAFLRDGERFLVIKRSAEITGAGYWTPPSGRIEPGESEQAAVRREMREELALDVMPLRKIWECDADHVDIRLHWWAADFAGELRPEPAEVEAARWVTAAEFLELEPTFAGDREFVTSVLPTLD